jgi:type II secretory pathway component GspD/PulD (secretin)
MALNDTIVVYDYPEKIEKAAEVIKSIDIRPKQVLVEATILSVLLTEGMELGVNLNFLAGVSLDGSSLTDQIGDTDSLLTTTTTPISQVAAGVIGTPIETFGFAAVGGSGLRFGITAGNVSAFITALESVTDTTVLANPKILAVNKQQGSVLIGRNLGYRSSTTISTGGIATEGEVEFLQTGTQLVFRPFIGNDGYIRMDIYPKDSSAEIDNDGVPQETTTELSTNIIVKDGETIVIGGLFRDVVVTSRSQIPLLGDLPLIGGLFRSTSDQTRREEVIILLTTHIIEEPSEVEGEARADDVRRKRFGAKEELQWMGKARLVEDRYAKAARYYIEGDTEAAMKELEYVLELRPSYLEAIRLKERIIAETTPDEVDMIERIMLGNIEREDSGKWQRR